MKKIISVLFGVFALASIAFATPVNHRESVSAFADYSPIDVSVVYIGSGTGNQKNDSLLATAGVKVVGPIRLSKDAASPAFKYLGLKAPAGVVTASSGAVQIAYQILGSNNLADTTATWIILDTILPTGATKAAIDISAVAGQSIVFRVLNYPGSVTAILKKIAIVFKTASQLYVPSR